MKEDNLSKLRKLLKGKSSPEEADEIIKWINSRKAANQLGDQLEEFKDLQNYGFKSDRVLSNILNQIEKEELINVIESSVQKTKIREFELSSHRGLTSKGVRTFLKIAASISIIVMTFLGGYYLNDTWSDSDKSGLEYQHGLLTKSTESGQKLTFHLSDGTMVKLNANSTLTFPRAYSEDKREVWLQGEAFFEVTENPEKPFIVITDQISTTALGTSFTVRAMEKRHHAVYLLTGKVNVVSNNDPHQNRILLPGEKVTYQEENGRNNLIKGAYNVELETGWKDGILMFEKTPFHEVIAKIETWYGITIEVDGKIPDGLFANSRFQNDYLKEVMASLGYSWGFEFEIQEAKNNVLIKFNQKANTMK